MNGSAQSDGTGVTAAGPGLWHVRVCRTDPRSGKRINRKATVRGTRSDAISVRDRLRVEVVAGGARVVRVRLGEYALRWIAARERVVKPSVGKRYRLALERHVIPALGDLYLDAIAPTDVRAYVAARTASGAAGNTVLNELRVLRTLARDAAADGHGEGTWCDRVAAPQVARYTVDRPNLLSADEFHALIENVPAGWKPLVVFLATTGLRWGEATGLRWGDIDRGVATVRGSNWKGRRVEPKTPRSYRAVPVPPDVIAMLGPAGSPDALVFTTRRGGPHRGSPLRSVLDRACVAAGVPRVTTHGLRRTFNNLARRIGDRTAVRAIMGHTADSMTEHYSLASSGEKASLTSAVARELGVFRVLSVSRGRSLAPEGHVGSEGTGVAEVALQTVALPLGYGTEAQGIYLGNGGVRNVHRARQLSSSG